MKIPKAQLIEMDACKDGLDRFIKQTNDTDESVEVSSLVGGVNTYSDLLWLAGRIVDRSKIIRFTCECALLNIELIKPYTDKYDMIVDFLINPTDAAAHAARAATAYAHIAAYAASDDAAINAAVNAAHAAHAANAAIGAAAIGAAAAYAANAAADANGADKVNELLIKLFED